MAVSDVARTRVPVTPAYQALPAAATLFFCVFVVLWYLQIGYRSQVLGGIRFELLYGLALGMVVVAAQPSLGSPLTPHLAALLLCIAVQVPFSYDVQVSFDVFVDRVLKFFWMSIFIVTFVTGPRELRWFLAAFLVACFKMGYEGFLGQITGSLLWQNQGVMRLHGTTLMYSHPNSFAGMALGTLPFAFYLYPICGRALKALLVVLAVFAGNIIIFTGSRTGYVGLLGFVAFVALKSKRKLRAAAAIVLVAAVGLPFVPADYVERFGTIFTQVEKEGRSSELRVEILRDAWQVFLTHPAGVGVGAFPAVRDQMFGRRQDTHNLYLEVGTNLGVQGLVVFALFILVQLRLLSRLTRDFDAQLTALHTSVQPSDLERAGQWRAHVQDLQLLRRSALAVQGFLVIRLVLGLFGMDLYAVYWWFAMGLAIALFKIAQVARARTEYFIGSPLSACEPTAPGSVWLPRRLPGRGCTA